MKCLAILSQAKMNYITLLVHRSEHFIIRVVGVGDTAGLLQIQLWIGYGFRYPEGGIASPLTLGWIGVCINSVQIFFHWTHHFSSLQRGKNYILVWDG